MAIFCICFSPASDDSYVLPGMNWFKKLRLYAWALLLAYRVRVFRLGFSCLSFCLIKSKDPQSVVCFPLQLIVWPGFGKGPAKGFRRIHKWLLGRLPISPWTIYIPWRMEWKFCEGGGRWPWHQKLMGQAGHQPITESPAVRKKKSSRALPPQHSSPLLLWLGTLWSFLRARTEYTRVQRPCVTDDWSTAKRVGLRLPPQICSKGRKERSRSHTCLLSGASSKRRADEWRELIKCKQWTSCAKQRHTPSLTPCA
jgi:hypothetical protein